MPTHPAPHAVLSFAVSDPSGGGGLQGGLLTIAALGAHPLSVLTGISVRDSVRSEGLQATDGDWVADQARALLEDMPVHAFVIGQLASPENVTEVADVLTDYPDLPVVFAPDPGSAGDPLAEEEMLEALCELLVPQSTVLIADGELARRLTSDEEEQQESDITSAEYARRLLEFGAAQVLLTGAREPGPQLVNTLYGSTGVLRTDAWERLPGSFHGAGDTLAAALATFLAQGMELSAAVHAAQSYTWQALAQGWRPGMGPSFPNRFCTWSRP
ncbi:hydroxymethylpyrimidine/phosphomethylpyrimidine kinase [Uliginosibacterium sp. 31-12]|uniref:bifunctional hydroxymethylpyrimidine kinase/phosphomethylpyrimidine kinase n=1 Tax=Uliginosibacterium sp. 31-12 TaxID=3062781 RepID=UPI0026E36F62|nr:hydroxymethylpyrimidine/phosphomethylpyrimidine kinase [Uliginosibacterium sp. 31-12]MDO6386285.1 hydroxymethylpyrimidine/phosphomethylpyrimidine kinase [Uliginosibacterium sp. 31-12]